MITTMDNPPVRQEVIEGCVDRYSGYLKDPVAQRLREALFDECAKKCMKKKHFGDGAPYWDKDRLQGRFGDENVPYSYKGKNKRVNAWTPALLELKEIVSGFFDVPFNCAVVNFYLTEMTNIYPHTDIGTIPELGPEPKIGIISLGDRRDMHFTPMPKGSGEDIICPLEHGDLFLFHGRSQLDYKHGIPRQVDLPGSRVSVTFRHHIEVL